MASGGIAHLRNALDSFRCYLDKDIEEFLREKALSFLDRKFCSVYLIVDEQAFDAGHVTAAPLSSAEILDNAFEVIQDADALIPCRCALVECSENEKVHQVYLDYGFHFFQFDGTHHQFYKRI